MLPMKLTMDMEQLTLVPMAQSMERLKAYGTAHGTVHDTAHRMLMCMA